MKRVKLLLVALLYAVALAWAYAAVVSPAFSYDGANFQWPGAGAMIWVILLAAAPAFAMPMSLERPSTMIVWWLYVSAYVPSILVPAMSLNMRFEDLLPLQLSLLFCMGIFCLVSSARLLAVPRIAVSPSLFWAGFLAVWLLCLGVVCTYGRVSMLVPNLQSVLQGGSEYDIRGAFSDAITQVGRFLGYTCGQTAQAFNPFLIAFGIVYRKRLCLIAGILGQIIIFGLVGIKSALFSILFLPLLFVCMTRWRRNFGLALTSVLIAAIMLCAFADRATNNVIFSSMLTRRTLSAPGLLTGFYFEHYSQVPHAGIGYHFSHSGPIAGPPSEIGLVYFGDARIDANANLWAEGFADFGLPGVIGFTLLVAFAIWLYDSISARHDVELAVLLAAMPALMFSNTIPTTVLITHGGIMAALLLYFVPAAHHREECELIDTETMQPSRARNHRLKFSPAPIASPLRLRDRESRETPASHLAVATPEDSAYGNLGSLAH